MFCVNCGKEIANDARFCSFCGAPVRDVIVRTAAAEPQKEPAVENEVLTAEQPVSENAVQALEQTVSEENALTPVQTAPENAVSEEQTSETPQSTIPTPNVIPTSGESLAYANIPNAQNVPPVPPAAPVSPAAAPKKHDAPERRFTLGHIFICLAAVAIMAITAGVFAGLYFSVV